MACLHERRFPLCFDGQAKRLLWFFFSASANAKRKADNKAVDQNTCCQTCSGTEGNHLSVPPGHIQMLCFRLGCFSTMLYQITSAAQSLGEVRITEEITFFGVSIACTKSPAEAQRTETPMGQQLPPVSQQDMVKHNLNDM